MEKTEKRLLNIMLPVELIQRVNAVCADKDITIQEFVADAILDRLELVYKDRRRRQRL